MKKTLFYLFIFILVAGCSSNNTKSGINIDVLHKNSSCLFLAQSSNNNRYYIVDTGASSSILNSKYLKHNNPKKIHKNIKTPFGEKQIQTTPIKSIDIKNTSFKFRSPVNAGVTNLKNIEDRTNLNIEGVIGLDILGGMILEYRQSKKSAKLYPTSNISPKTDTFKTHKLNSKGRLKSIKINNTKAENLILDTGATTSGLKNNTISQLSSQCTTRNKKVSTLRGDVVQEAWICQDITINNQKFKKFKFYSERLNNLGTDYLCNTDFYIDFPKRTLYLKR